MPHLRKVTQIKPFLPSYLALPVMCCQPQQKSGRKQPETNTSLPLQGMLCLLKGEGGDEQASRAGDKLKNV